MPPLCCSPEETDNVVLWFVCEPANRRIRVLIPAPDEGPNPPAITLRSGSVQRGYALITVDPDGVLIASAPMDDPVLQSFACSGALTYTEWGTVTDLPAETAEERRAIGNFVVACSPS